MSLIITGGFARRFVALAVLAAIGTCPAMQGSVAAPAETSPAGPMWKRHTIDNAARGADGVRLADINGDGLLDIATGFEGSGVTRVYINPGPARAKAAWPAVTVGAAGDVEDAVFADLDGDGGMDVVSCSEGRTRAIWIHWGPRDRRRQLEPSAWQTEPLPAVAGRQWMFCVPLQLDGSGGLDLLVGSKGDGGCVGWLQSPADPRQVAGWTFHEIRPAGWVMSLIPADMDADGTTDLVLSDRKRTRTGVFWLKNPGPGPAQSRPWQEHAIGSIGREVMFATLADLDQDGLEDVVVSVAPREIHWHRRLDRTGTRWESRVIPQPENTGTAKAVAVGDLDLDGRMDLAFDCEGAVAPKHGLMWLANANPFDAGGWIAHPLSGVDGIKHDLIALVDLDGDGDPDVLTTEEARRLGVIWYENPARRKEPLVRGEPGRETLNVALVTSASVFGDVPANLAHFEQIIGEAAAAGARLVCFPELALVSYSTHPDVLKAAEPIPGPVTQRLAAMAAARNVYISAGMAEREGDRCYITQIFVGPSGYLGKYRKRFPTPGERACGFTPGQEYPVWEVDGFRFGIVICADGRQEETILEMKKAGVDVIHHPHGNHVGSLGSDAEEWTRSKVVYLAPRAITARAHTLVNNSAGDIVEPNGAQRFSSGAVVIDPLGQIVRRTDQRDRAERWILATLTHPLDVIPPGELRRMAAQDPEIRERVARRAKSRTESAAR